MQVLERFFKLEKMIHKHFGYVEYRVKIPLEDSTHYHWAIIGGEGSGGEVFFSPKPLTPELIVDGNELFSSRIYTQRFLKKWVYRTDDYTMICADTQCDGNKFLSIFDNEKEVKTPTPEQLEAFGRW